MTHADHIYDFAPCDVCGDCLTCAPHIHERLIVRRWDWAGTKPIAPIRTCRLCAGKGRITTTSASGRKRSRPCGNCQRKAK
jgi:hypothetical protein